VDLHQLYPVGWPVLLLAHIPHSECPGAPRVPSVLLDDASRYYKSVPFSEQRHQGSHGQRKLATYVRHARIHPPVDLLHAAVHILLRHVLQR
jgi:hypothetical protein